MKGVKSENVDITFFLQQKLITPRKLRFRNEKTSVIHGWDIPVLSPAYDFS